MFDKLLVQLAVNLTPGTGDGQVDIPTLTSEQVLQNGLNIAYTLAGIIAVIVIIIGGIMYTISAGNSGSVTKAKNMVMYSVVGLVVVIIAFAVTNFVYGSFV